MILPTYLVRHVQGTCRNKQSLARSHTLKGSGRQWRCEACGKPQAMVQQGKDGSH